jgi:hypothetical protein
MTAKTQKCRQNNIWPILCMGLLCTACAPTAPPLPTVPFVNTSTVIREVFVFEDTNVNGQYDVGELPLPHVLITSHSNIHGSDKRIAKWTSDAGHATFEVSYTHYFDLYIVPLCGYMPTTPVHQDAKSSEIISFGLTPNHPRTGDALVRFFLWADENQDGQQNEGELPLSRTSLQITLSEGDRVAIDVDQDILAITTNETGWGEINLGNSCGMLNLWPQEFQPWAFRQWRIASTDPHPAVVAQNGPYEDSFWYYGFNYDLGETVIKVGLMENIPSNPP